MKHRKGILERVVHGSELGTETLPGQPLVELVGSNRVIIENHQGVTQYGRDSIHIKVRYGEIIVVGSGLDLAQMTKERLAIFGEIKEIRICGGMS